MKLIFFCSVRFHGSSMACSSSWVNMAPFETTLRFNAFPSLIRFLSCQIHSYFIVFCGAIVWPLVTTPWWGFCSGWNCDLFQENGFSLLVKNQHHHKINLKIQRGVGRSNKENHRTPCKTAFRCESVAKSSWVWTAEKSSTVPSSVWLSWSRCISHTTVLSVYSFECCSSSLTVLR